MVMECNIITLLNKTGTAVNRVKSLLKSWQAFAGQQKLVMILIMILLFFTAVPVLFNMYTDKDSNLISDNYITIIPLVCIDRDTVGWTDR